MSGNGNGNDKDEKTKGFNVVKQMTEKEKFKRQARGVDFARNITALAKKFNLAPIESAEKLGLTLEGANGEWYAWDELLVRSIAYMEKLVCEAEKK